MNGLLSRRGREYVANLIKDFRLAQAITQKQMADTYNLSLHVIRDLEQGKMTPSYGSVLDVLKACHLQIRIE